MASEGLSLDSITESFDTAQAGDGRPAAGGAQKRQATESDMARAYKAATGKSAKKGAAKKQDRRPSDEVIRRSDPDDGGARDGDERNDRRRVDDEDYQAERAWDDAELDSFEDDEGYSDDDEQPAVGGERKGLAVLSHKQMGAIDRDGTLPKSVLDQMTDDELSAYADGLIARQARDDEWKRSVRQNTQAAKDTTQDTGEDSAAPNRGAAADRPSQVDLSKVVRPLVNALGLDSEDEPKLIGLANGIREAVLAELKPEADQARQFAGDVGGIKADHDETMKVVLRLAADSIRADLKAKWSRVGDDVAWRKVREEAQALRQTGGYQASDDPFTAIRRAFVRAAERVLGDPDDRSRSRRRQTSRDRGAEPPGRGAGGGKPKAETQEQRDRRVFREVTRKRRGPGSSAAYQG